MASSVLVTQEVEIRKWSWVNYAHAESFSREKIEQLLPRE